jgi:uncharacterized protein
MPSQQGLSGVVVKIASRCNINCSYCYMYQMGDESYRFLPKVMAYAQVDQLMERVSRHCDEFKLTEFEFILHGGEPLLAGKQFFGKFVEKARAALGTRVKLKFGVQTNGVLLDAAWCEYLNDLSFHIGISLDGPAHWHDRFRKDHRQLGTHARTVAGLKAAQLANCRLGILAVMDAASDPLELYAYFQDLGIGYLDFLWPDYHHDKPPPLYAQRASAPDYTPYGDWWIRLFDCWFTDRGTKPRIRFLNQLIFMILGIDTGFESIGQEENRYLIVETDGGIEASDYLKACGDGFTKEGMHLAQHEFSEVYASPLVNMHRQSHRLLPKLCRQCRIRQVCGGGHLAHRFSAENRFANASVYCYDLMKLLTHVQNVLLSHLSSGTIEGAGLARTTYTDALKSINIVK